MEQVAYKINDVDNVATVLTPIQTGKVSVRGCGNDTVIANENINIGHKIALCPISMGDPIIKYGINIGSATQAIKTGDWVHLHVMHSNYDDRSSHLDLVTGAPKDVKYE